MTYPEHLSQPQHYPAPQPQASGPQPVEGYAPGGAPYPADSSGHPGGPVYPDPQSPYSVPGQPLPWGQPPAAAGCSAPWFLGLIALVPIPLMGTLAGGLAQIVAGLVWNTAGSSLKHTQARQAASWGLTYSLCAVVLLVAHFVVLFVYTKGGSTKDMFPVGIPLLLFAVVTLLHLILSVVGGVRAMQGKTMPFFGIPFFR